MNADELRRASSRYVRPNALVIGAARSGTTALSESLRAHPDVFMTQPKEPHFFAFADREVDFRGPGDRQTINRDVVSDPDAYLALYDGPGARARVRGDASVSTLYHPDRAIPAILQHAAPDVRLIAVLRDPVARAFSSFQYLRVRGLETVETLAEAVQLEDDRIAAGYHHLWHYAHMSRYAEQLQPFLDQFGDRLLVLDHDELLHAPGRALRRVAVHLGIDHQQLARPGAQANSSGQARSRAFQRALTLAVQSPVRPLLKALVPFTVRERIRAANLRPASASPADAAAVLERIDDDLARLPDLVPHLRAGWMPAPAAT